MGYTVMYDEVLVITKGRFSIRTDDSEATAGAGEILYINRETSVAYASHEEVAEMVYVTHPGESKRSSEAALNCVSDRGAGGPGPHNLLPARAKRCISPARKETFPGLTRCELNLSEPERT